MRTKFVTGAVVTDLGVTSPFLPGYTVVAANPTASAVTLQLGDASTGPFATAKQPNGTNAVIPAGGSIEVQLTARYAAIENGVGQIQLFQN
jgi:type 1 fimbria pilin